MPDKTNKTETEPYPYDDLRTRLSFLKFNQQDEEHLKALSEVFAPHIPDIVHSFYQHLQGFEETASLLTDELITTRLLEAQRNYLERLTAGNYDQDYAAERSQIGYTHNRVGLEPRWYIGTYSLYINLLVPLICQAYRDEPERLQNALLALTKILMLDMQLAIDAYIERQQLEAHIIQSERFAAIGQLAARVAHEIRNPLSSVALNLDLLADEVADGPKIDVAEAKDLLQSIDNEVERLANIVSEYLEFARLPRFEFEHESLNTVVQTFCDFIEPQLQQAQITFSIELAENLPFTLLDAEQIQCVLHNLFKNAIEAMPSGGEFSIRTSVESSRIVLRVSDTGVGISPPDQKRIFDPFFTTKKDGTGLGLSLVGEIIKQHQGTILCRSVVDQGTQFIITFPIRDEESIESGSIEQAVT